MGKTMRNYFKALGYLLLFASCLIVGVGISLGTVLLAVLISPEYGLQVLIGLVITNLIVMFIKAIMEI
jgi:cyanate permease